MIHMTITGTSVVDGVTTYGAMCRCPWDAMGLPTREAARDAGDAHLAQANGTDADEPAQEARPTVDEVRASLTALGTRPGIVKVKPNVAPFAGRTGIIDAGNPRTVINGMVRVYFPGTARGPLVWRTPAVDYYHPRAVEHQQTAPAS